MILLKILFVCLIVLPFFVLCLYLIRYTNYVLRKSSKKQTKNVGNSKGKLR